MRRDSEVEEVWKDIGENQDEIMTMNERGKGGGGEEQDDSRRHDRH